ncbi:outer membrane beta-barrel protein [Helicobacter sp. 11S02629-2]|uniref:outer membrane beta-barrel protein n=1 Tax=Helicobacter sp. 11S02629-2 TaxID=1476195 RepID=UPI000BA7502E|nr:outer membrane beta-barrel protein [Helicobacter sp. 11S02629-2]PAF44341.1 hypothetical protein BKH40_05450 [Helicobacter sp. 11S02629-2]
MLQAGVSKTLVLSSVLVFGLIGSLNAKQWYDNGDYGVFVGASLQGQRNLKPFIDTKSSTLLTSNTLDATTSSKLGYLVQAGAFYYPMKYVGFRAYYAYGSFNIANNATFTQTTGTGSTTSSGMLDNQGSFQSANLDLLLKYDISSYLSASFFVGLGFEHFSMSGSSTTLHSNDTGVVEPTLSIDPQKRNGAVVNAGILVNFFRFNQIELGMKLPTYDLNTTSSYQASSITTKQFYSSKQSLPARFYMGYNLVFNF